MKKEFVSIGKVLVFAVFASVVILTLSFVGYYTTYQSTDAFTQNSKEEAYPVVTFILDAGHGGEDGGAEANGVVEKDINFAVTKKLAEYLSLTPFAVVLTRTEDRLLYQPGEESQKKYHDLIGRINFAKNFENGIFISIHQNKFEIPKYKGLQVYYSPNHKQSATLAGYIQTGARMYLSPENTRETKKADHKIRILKALEMPAVLVECGFLSNPEEAALLSDNTYQNKLAFTIFLSINQFLQEQIKPNTTENAS